MNARCVGAGSPLRRGAGVRNHRSGSGRWLALTLVTLALAALAAARADAYLYWTDGGGVGTTTIGRANFDGTGVKTNFITGDIYNGALAVHGAYIYWPGLNTGRIWRANLSGTGPNQILMSNLDSPTGLAVDGAHIYWAALITGGEFVQTAIGRATFQGGGVTDIDDTFITVPNQPNNGSPADVHGVAVDSNYIYWANSSAGTIGRANLNGQSVDQSFIGGQNSPWGVAVDSAAIPAPDRQIYWTNSAFPGGTVGRAKLSDPTNVDLSIPGFAPTGVAADATHIFWVNRKTNSIGRANLDGTGVAASFMSQGISPTSIAVDALGGACEGREPTLVGTHRQDRLRGTNRRDVISALGGDDTVAGLGGDDLVCGAGGDDVLRGHGGDDELRGGRDNDTLGGGPGADLHRGGPGNDTCHGGGGRDRKQGC
jgi:hypothetical protein